jgi:two-component system cell cycle sensor histidine kinase/response regulator CckA
MPSRGPLLIVEDDEALRHVIVTWLRHRGFELLEADSAEVAVELLDAGAQPALVLLDLNLPGSTGWELLRSERFRRPDAPPVVIASAVTVDYRRLAEFGVAGYLPKPFPLETLLATIERVLASQSATPEEIA